MPSILELRPRWVVPMAGPPLAGGVVSVVGERVAAVSSAGSNPIDLGDVAIIPGLVNAHTHLEFSCLPAPLGSPGMEFTAWIREVIAHRRNVEPQPAALTLGAAECIRSGTSTIGEISKLHRFSASMLPEANLVDFGEVICLDPERIHDVFTSAREHVGSRRQVATRYWPGISPHAPYSVHHELLERVVEFSASTGAALAMHVAESPAELELLATGGGPFRELLEELGVWRDGAVLEASRPRDYLQLLAEAARALVIHGNYLAADEIELLAEHREHMALVYCPRTHAFFGHPRHPLAELLRAGARVALGTDGRSSNPDLSLLADMRFAAASFPEIAPERFLRMATIEGAEALGIASQTGSLEAGKFADLACVPIEGRLTVDPYTAVVHGELPVVATMFRGQWSWIDPDFAPLASGRREPAGDFNGA